MRVSILNGPNLNLLGTREPEIYGSETLSDIETMCRAAAHRYSIELTFRQSNHEGVLVDWVQEARENTDALIINGGAFTHTSIALLDALKSLSIPILEVHLSNIYRREAFRQHSYISQAASGLICGLGSKSYLLALEWLAANVKK